MCEFQGILDGKAPTFDGGVRLVVFFKKFLIIPNVYDAAERRSNEVAVILTGISFVAYTSVYSQT
jgi:hypothetical protein